jgi:hypothetical protein
LRISGATNAASPDKRFAVRDSGLNLPIPLSGNGDSTSYGE